MANISFDLEQLRALYGVHKRSCPGTFGWASVNMKKI